VLGSNGVIDDKDKVAPYNRDWMHKYEGQAQVVLRPHSTEQVSEVLSYCSMRRLAVVPQGGNTGLVGGSIPVFDEVILSTSSLNKVLTLDKSSGALVAQAGCVLQALDEHVASHGYMMPLDLGAKGSCQIGGNVSTNAGGLRLLRYGSLHGSVLGVEVVLADGTVLDLLRTLRKDNTGYDLKQLFIGGEGTLGVVTAVAIQCAPRPASVQVVFLSCQSFDAVQAVLSTARRMLGEILSAAEFLDGSCMALVTEQLEGVVNPLGQGGAAPFYMVLETHGSNAKHDVEKLEAFLEAVMSAGHVQDGTVSQSESQAAAIWRVREGIAEALGRKGAVYKYDLSMPTGQMYGLVEEMRGRLRGKPGTEGISVVGYGHVGDGNLHLNVCAPKGYNEQLTALIEPYVYEWTTARKGSVSAEHGVGRMKAEVVGLSRPPDVLEVMARIKQVMDPRGILNPYKLLPQKYYKELHGVPHGSLP